MAGDPLSGLRLALRVKPGAGRDEIAGIETDSDGRMSLLVKVRAQPEKGRANSAVIELLAEALGLPKSRVTILAGGTGRRKTVFIAGDAADIRASLQNFIGEIS